LSTPTKLTSEEVGRRGGSSTLARHGREHFQDAAESRWRRAREIAAKAPPLTPEEIIALRQIIASAGLVERA
jgi:hypothetical protein